jgi:hypothetical protein
MQQRPPFHKTNSALPHDCIPTHQSSMTRKLIIGFLGLQWVSIVVNSIGWYSRYDDTTVTSTTLLLLWTTGRNPKRTGGTIEVAEGLQHEFRVSPHYHSVTFLLSQWRRSFQKDLGSFFSSNGCLTTCHGTSFLCSLRVWIVVEQCATYIH